MTGPERLIIVCLCGTARFWRQFERSYLEETLAGRIILSIAIVWGGDEALFERFSDDEKTRALDMLTDLHLRKIDLADEVLILNAGGYIGTGTAREIAYARRQGKRVRFLESS